MLAVTFPGNAQIKVKEMAVPKPMPGEVLVKVGASAICGSEMRPFRSPEGLTEVPGHEMVGTVVENPEPCGPKVGDRVAINIISGCGQCSYCLRGDRRFCDQQGFVNGGHAEYVAVPTYTCMPLPDDIPFDIGVLIGGDTVGVAYHTFTKVKLAPRDTVALVGVGPVGLGFVALLSFLGMRTIVVEVSPYRRELVEQFGPEAVIDPGAVDALAAIRDLTHGRGADVSIDASGKDTGVNLALNAVRKEGTFVFAGAGREATVKPWEQFLAKEIVAYGVWYFTDADYVGMVQAYRDGLKVDGILTHRFHLPEAPNAYELFSSAQTGKVVFVPRD